MRINHNIAAFNTYRMLSMNNANASKSLEKLSSGLRINRAGDDAAGLAISEKMRAQIRGLDQATRNAQDGISLIQTAEGALNETHAILQRMRELAVQSANDTNTSNDRAEIQKEVDQLAIEITRIANNTEFNTQKLLNGGITTAGISENVFHIGANADQKLTVSIGAMDAYTLGVSRDGLTANVGTGAVAIDSAGVSEPAGAAIVNAAAITVSAADNAGASATATVKAATGDTITIDLGAAGVAGNSLKINLTTGADTALDVTAADGTITIALGTDVANNTAAKIQTAIRGLTAADVNGLDLSTATVTAGGDWDANAIATGETGAVSFAGGADANAAETIVTLTDTSSNTQTVVVADTATTVSVNTGVFQGLSFTTTDVTSAAGTISIATDPAAAAVFTNNALTSEATTSGGIDVSTQVAANTAITSIETAITSVSSERSKLGAVQNRLEHTITNLSTSSENLTASESRIRDVDMAKEMMEFTKNSILMQAAQAMLAQANQQPQGVLQLLR